MTPEELSPPRYELLGQMSHATLAEFVIEYFLRRWSWLTWLHHALTLIALGSAIGCAVVQSRGVIRTAGDFVLAIVLLVVVLLPLHEALHALAYRLCGARDIRWDYSLRMMAVWVSAHQFVVGRGAFVFVALAPFVVLNALLVAGAILWPAYAVLFFFLLALHLHGCAGDWSLLNFVWLHRRRGFWTFDDADSGQSYFFGRAA